MFRRAISAVAASAVVLGGLTFGAVPANAAVSGEQISPTIWTVGTSSAVEITWTESAVTSSVMVRSPWPWPANYPAGTTGSPSQVTADILSTTRLRCPIAGTTGIIVSSPQFNVSAAPTCNFVNSVAQTWTGFYLDGGNFGMTGAPTIEVSIPSGVVVAPSTPRRDTWLVGPYSLNFNSGTQKEVATTVVGTDGEVPEAPPTIRLEINGNGGVCTPSFVEGEQGTWGTAPTADKCTNGSRQLAFFSTSPTAAIGATNVRPGGPVFFLTANLFYAIWAPEKPSPVTDVVATPGLNSVKVTWKAPVSDGGDPINSYCVALRTEQNSNPFPRCSSVAEPLERTVNLPATNSKYTFTVFARNSAGSSELVAGAPVSPYDIKGVTASRKDVLFGLRGTRVEAKGDAPGLAGQSLNVEYKVGAGQWTTQANAVSVDAKSNFRWSKKFPRSSNKNAVTVRFSYGTDAVAGPLVLTRGGEAGDLSAPRNIKVDNRPNKIKVTWDRPKFDGGATITGYTLCATAGNGIGGRMCKSETGTEGTFWNLNTRQSYTFTVSAKTTTREGPVAKFAKTVDPTEASIRSAARSFDELTADVRGAGFKKNSRFRVEVASPVPGVNPDKWDWDQVTSFREDPESFTKSLRIPLDASVRGERLMLRLITPEGTVYSRSIRP